MKVTGKWLSISGSQDMASASALFNSFKDSMAGAGIDTLNGAVGVLRDPVASIDAMNAFILSVEGSSVRLPLASSRKLVSFAMRWLLVVMKTPRSLVSKWVRRWRCTPKSLLPAEQGSCSGRVNTF